MTDTISIPVWWFALVWIACGALGNYMHIASMKREGITKFGFMDGVMSVYGLVMGPITIFAAIIYDEIDHDR